MCIRLKDLQGIEISVPVGGWHNLLRLEDKQYSKESQSRMKDDMYFIYQVVVKHIILKLFYESFTK